MANKIDDGMMALIGGAEQARKKQEIVAAITEQSIREATDAAIHASRIISPRSGILGFGEVTPSLLQSIGLLIQTVVLRGENTPNGHVIEAIMIPWFAILAELRRDPNFMHQMSPAMLEEMIAGAYDLAGCDEVILTPRSGDRGRDVIATTHAGVTVKILDQAKKYKPGVLVDYDAIRAFLFVLDADRASKGYITTTSDFPPNLMKDPLIAPRIGTTLELINYSKLVDRLEGLANGGRPPSAEG